MSQSQPSWDHCRSFLSVLELGSLSAAARALGLTQPTVARHIETLEGRLGGARLFTRSPQGLEPTAAARRLAPYAETMAASADALLRVASAEAEQVSGAVRISASEVIGAEVLPGPLSELRAAHPALAIELVLSNAPSDLLRREVDIAVRMVRPTQQALTARKVGEIELALHARAEDLDRAGAPERIEDLTRHALIGFDRDVGSARGFAEAGFEPLREHFALRSDNQLAQLAAIRAGFGIGVCQIGLAKRAPVLTPVLHNLFRREMETWVVMHEDLRGDRRMRIVFDHLYEGLRAYAQTSC